MIRKVYKELGPSINESGVIDITVSYDDTWMTRGYKSIYGVGCVVEVITGLVLDFGILSLYCHGCASASACYGRTHTRELEEWKAGHTDCSCSYQKVNES